MIKRDKFQEIRNAIRDSLPLKEKLPITPARISIGVINTVHIHCPREKCEKLNITLKIQQK